MSWSIKVFIKKSDAPEVVRSWVAHQEVADFIVAQVGKIPDTIPGAPWDAANYVRIEGHGHGGNVGRLEVEGFNFTTPVPPPAPPVSNKFVASGCETFSATTGNPTTGESPVAVS